MDGDAEDLGLLVASARQEAAALRHDPRMRPGSGSRGAALRTHTIDLLDAVDHRLAQEPETSAPSAVRQAFARNVRQCIVVLRGAHAALPWLAVTRSPRVNLGSLYLTEEWADALIGKNVDLVVVPNAEFMYSTTSWPFAAVIGQTPGFAAATKRRPIVLNYPLTDNDRLLLHPIFAHELGHSAVDEYDLVTEVERHLDADSEFAAAIEQAVDELETVWPASDRARINGTVRARLRGWIEELLCDHLAVEACGPAFLCAFAVFVLPLSYGELGPVHPPNTVRVRLALEQLTRRGWRPFLDDVMPGVTRWLDAVAADAAAALHAPFGMFRDELVRRADIIQDVAIARVGTDKIDLDQTIHEADKAAALLRRLILPVGLSTPLSARGVLLGAWQHALTMHGDGPAGLVRALADERLQHLVGKAIELSTVASAWEGAAP